jgi:adenosylmethionine-8-amino-7-oxononanoate aminotransferase
MINKVETIQQIRLEILRRKTLADALKKDIKTDYKELKDSLMPMNLLKNALGNKTVATTAITSTAFAGLLFAARKTILDKTKGLANSAFGFIVPKIASAIASQASQTIFSKIKEALNKQK